MGPRIQTALLCGAQRLAAQEGQQRASLLREKGGMCDSAGGCEIDPVWGLLGEWASRPPLVCL